MADFYVRIFIYGLTGFILADTQTTLLLPAADGHHAFVAFTDGTCSPPPCQKFGKFQGFPLAGDQIDLPDLSAQRMLQGPHERQPRPPIIGQLPQGFDITLPKFLDDSAAFDWVTRMDQLGNAGTVDRDCLQGKANQTCNQPKGLKGRMVLTTGLLSTCRLIETGKPKAGCKGEVHTFHFPGTSGPFGLVEQALAEIEVAVTKVSGSSVTLTLTKLGDTTPWDTVTLKPQPQCIGWAQATNCVDIFVGNMPDAEGAADCHEQLTGGHFAALYGLLAPGSAVQNPLPAQDVDHWVPASDFQPSCQDVPSGADAKKLGEYQALTQLRNLEPQTAADRKRAAVLTEYLRSVLGSVMKYPGQRVICPMAAFNSPSSP